MKAWKFAALLIPGCAVLFSGCVSRPPAPTTRPAEARALISRLLPAPVPDRAGWITDIYTGFNELGIEPTQQNVCAVVAVAEQESGLRVNPVIPGLGTMARKEIDERASHAGVPLMLVHGALHLSSSDGRTYSERIDSAKTEKELSDIFEDFTGKVPLGHTLFAGWNPIRTRGPMQVNIDFAQSYARVRPYPYPVKDTIPNEVFTRRGGLYFGIAHLLAYEAPYDQYLYRFADFNAGQYASRNAAFQNAVSIASGIPLVDDGALLPHDGSTGNTELAVRALAGRLNISEDAIHSALEEARTQEFERTAVYERVFSLAEKTRGHPLPRALVPSIQLHSPKIVRKLTTDWYAHRVDGRFERCMRK